MTGRCIIIIETGHIVRSVAWCSNPNILLITIANGQRLILTLVSETQLLMQSILRCDFEGFRRILNQIEASADAKLQKSNKATNSNLTGTKLRSGSHFILDCNLDTQFPCYQVS